MKRLVRIASSSNYDDLYSVYTENAKGERVLKYSTHHLDSAYREADKLSGNVIIVYPNGEEKVIEGRVSNG